MCMVVWTNQESPCLRQLFLRVFPSLSGLAGALLIPLYSTSHRLLVLFTIWLPCAFVTFILQCLIVCLAHRWSQNVFVERAGEWIKKNLTDIRNPQGVYHLGCEINLSAYRLINKTGQDDNPHAVTKIYVIKARGNRCSFPLRPLQKTWVRVLVSSRVLPRKNYLSSLSLSFLICEIVTTTEITRLLPGLWMCKSTL